MICCDACETPTCNPEDDYGEHICDNCAEAAWERMCEDFHDGGSAWPSLREQQIAARRLK